MCLSKARRSRPTLKLGCIAAQSLLPLCSVSEERQRQWQLMCLASLARWAPHSRRRRAIGSVLDRRHLVSLLRQACAHRAKVASMFLGKKSSSGHASGQAGVGRDAVPTLRWRAFPPTDLGKLPQRIECCLWLADRRQPAGHILSRSWPRFPGSGHRRSRPAKCRAAGPATSQLIGRRVIGVFSPGQRVDPVALLGTRGRGERPGKQQQLRARRPSRCVFGLWPFQRERARRSRNPGRPWLHLSAPAGRHDNP
jgi:hypothetical protein